MGNASRGHRKHGVLSIADIPHVRTEKIVDQERRKEGLRYVSKIHRDLRKISRFRRRSLTVNKNTKQQSVNESFSNNHIYQKI